VELTTDLLELAEAGQQPVDVTSVSVSDVVAQILLEKAAAFSSGPIEVRVGDDLGVIHASETHVYQVFTNLIDNSIKYGLADSPVISVTYLGSDATGAHSFVVRDNGPGITPDSLEHLFEPFFKGEGGGTGIGLATVEKIVGVYGGGIKARNDAGAVFEFTMRDLSPRRDRTDALHAQVPLGRVGGLDELGLGGFGLSARDLLGLGADRQLVDGAGQTGTGLDDLGLDGGRGGAGLLAHTIHSSMRSGRAIRSCDAV